MNGEAIHKKMLQILSLIGSIFIYGSNHTHKALSPRDANALNWVQKNERYIYL